MIRERIPETDVGIQSVPVVADFDRFARTMRNRGWIATDSIIRIGIAQGRTLEIGPGPGYLGLEWLKKTEGTRLTGLEISPAMIGAACRNRGEYGMEGRAEYVLGNAMEMPFEACSFDGVFSNGSLHEWEDPSRVFYEIARILKRGGKFYISDMRRDTVLPIRAFMSISAIPVMRAGLKSSLRASYTQVEAKALVPIGLFEGVAVSANSFGLTISGQK